jgi:hypothetical protein
MPYRGSFCPTDVYVFCTYSLFWEDAKQQSRSKRHAESREQEQGSKYYYTKLDTKIEKLI